MNATAADGVEGVTSTVEDLEREFAKLTAFRGQDQLVMAEQAAEIERLREAAAEVVETWMKAQGHHDDIVLERRICDLEEMIPTDVLARHRIIRPDCHRPTSAQNSGGNDG